MPPEPGRQRSAAETLGETRCGKLTEILPEISMKVAVEQIR
jgi:hypothetical protein